MALGLNYPRMMVLVVLPQALTMVIPGIVNNFVGLFMDTTLISVVGVTDFLEAMNNAFKDPVWSGPTIMTTGYVFAGLFYFIFCYGMARYSGYVERMLGQEKNRMTLPGRRERLRRRPLRRSSQVVRKFPRAAQHQPYCQAWRTHRCLRAVRVRQIHANSMH